MADNSPGVVDLDDELDERDLTLPDIIAAVGRIVVGSTTTGAPGTPAIVTSTPVNPGIRLDFTIPEGDKGDKGDTGDVTPAATAAKDAAIAARDAAVSAEIAAQTAQGLSEVAAGQSSASATAAQGVVANLSGSIDLTDALTKIALFVMAASTGASSLTVNLDGSVDIDLARFESIDTLSVTSTRQVIQTALGGLASEVVGVDTAVGAGLIWAVQIGAALAIAVNDDGTVDIDLFRSEVSYISNLFAGRVFLQDALGNVAGRIEPFPVEDAMSGVVDSGVVSPFMVNSDGSVDFLQDDAARFSGNALVTSKVVLRTNMTGLNRRSVTAYWRDGSGNDGLTTTVAGDATADYSIAGFDDVSGRAVVNRRLGDWQQTYSIDATINNGPLLPLASSREIFMVGDSFDTLELAGYIVTNCTDKNRAMEISGSGGAWLTASLAVLGGPATPSGVGADGGVVPASQVGSVPNRSGGTARTSMAAQIDNGTPGVTGNILTVTSLTAGGPIQVGDQVIVTSGTLTVGIPPTVLAFGTGGTTGTGGAGTYQLSNTANVPAGAIYAGPWTYPGLKQFWGRTLVIMDGGLDDAGDGAAAIIARILAFGQVLTPLAKRWYYVQPGIDRTSSPAAVTTWLSLQAAIKTGIGASHYIDTYDYMRSHGTGSTTGSNGGAVWAADNYGDNLHPSSPMGKANLGACIAAFIEAKGN